MFRLADPVQPLLCLHRQKTPLLHKGSEVAKHTLRHGDTRGLAAKTGKAPVQQRRGDMPLAKCGIDPEGAQLVFRLMKLQDVDADDAALLPRQHKTAHAFRQLQHHLVEPLGKAGIVGGGNGQFLAQRPNQAAEIPWENSRIYGFVGEG